MRRRSSSSSVIKGRDKSKIRRFIPGPLRSSDFPFASNFASSSSSYNQDMNGKKRKFHGPQTDHMQPNAGSLQNKPVQDPPYSAADAPKTSEYAFFKKFKKDAGLSDVKHLRRQDDHVKHLDISDCTTEKGRTLKKTYKKGLMFSVPVGKETHEYKYFSPPVSASKSSEITNVVGPNCTSISYSLLSQKVRPAKHNRWRSTFHGDPDHSGKQYSEMGVFSLKRQKLRQWLADSSFHEVDELCSKGYKLVDVLLSRLFQESSEYNRAWQTKSNQMEIDTRCQLPSFPHYDTQSMGQHWNHRNNLTESRDGSYQDDGFSRYWSESHGNVILPELDNVAADSPSTSYPIKSHVCSRYRIPYSNLDGRITESWLPESSSRFHLSFDGYESDKGDHPKESDRFDDRDGSSVQELPHTLLLGWDYNNKKDERDLSITSSSSDMSLLPYSGDDDQWQNHDRHSETALCSPSPSANLFLSSTSLAHARFLCTRDFGRQFKDENHLLPKLEYHFPLTFSCNPDSPKYLTIAQNCTTDTISDQRSITWSSEDHPWSLNKIIYEKYDIDLGSDHSSLLDSSAEYPSSILNAIQYPQDGENAVYFLGDEEKECCLYDSNRANDLSEETLNWRDCPKLNFQMAHDLHCSRYDSPKRGRYLMPNLGLFQTEADDEWRSFLC